MSPIRAMFAMLVAMLCLTPVAARAATGAVAEAAATRVTEGTLLFRGGDGAAVPAPLLETDVDLRVTGPVARAIVRQQFVNPTSDWVEGVYVFPLPDDAAVGRRTLSVARSARRRAPLHSRRARRHATRRRRLVAAHRRRPRRVAHHAAGRAPVARADQSRHAAGDARAGRAAVAAGLDVS